MLGDQLPMLRHFLDCLRRKQASQLRDALGRIDRLMMMLPQELGDRGPKRDRLIELWVGTWLVRAHRDQVAVFLVSRVDLAEPRHELLLILRGIIITQLEIILLILMTKQSCCFT